MNSRYVSRVNKLDALQLDAAINQILREQQSQLKYGNIGKIWLDYQKYLNLLSSSTIWWFSVKQHHATLGQQLLALRYDPKQLSNTSTLWMHFLLYVVIPHCHKLKIETGSKVVDAAETLYLVAKVWIFFRFCRNGQRPTLTDKILDLDLKCTEMKRTVSYHFMNRELIWNGFMEFLTYIIPLVNWTKLKNAFRQSRQCPIEDLSADSKVVFSTKTQCSYCNERPTLPHSLGCGHVYCYYCLMGSLKADKGFGCVECGLQASISVKSVYNVI